MSKEKVIAAIKAEVADRPPKEDVTRPENEVEAAWQKEIEFRTKKKGGLVERLRFRQELLNVI